MLAQDQFLSAPKFLLFGTSSNQAGLNIRDPSCFSDILVNESVKRESVFLFQIEANLAA